MMRIYLVAALYGVMLLSASTIPAAGLAESKFPSLKTLKQTNVALEMIGFGFGSGLQPNSNGEPNGNGFDILSQKWVGSGFIVSNDGSVITNYHVARRALYGLAKFEDGSSYNISEIRAYSPYDDLAILKISAIENFKKVRLGNSDDVQPLDNVLAVGNPHGQGINISEGQISQIIQNEKAHVTLIVHTAPITSGNSGGALYKENRVIAVNASVMLAPYGGGTGFNHAIPINRVKDLLEKYGDQSIPLSRAFSVDKSIIIKTKFEEISAANGSVPAADGEIPGVYPYDFTLSQLEDYLIIINSPGRDLALIVTDSQDMIGFGDIREVDFEGVILANSLTRNIRINVINYDPQPANFGIHVGCIIW